MITVDPSIDAVNDDFSSTPVPSTGGTTASVFAGDDLNGATPTATSVDVTLTDLGGLTGATINADGTIDVPSGTTPGNYTLTYRICEAGATTLCDTATVMVAVDPMINAVPDDFTGTPIPFAGGTTASVFTGDDLNGATPTATSVDVTLTDLGGLTGATINADGTIDVPANTTPGPYTLTYRICEAGATTLCDTATVMVVIGPSIDAVVETYPPVNNSNGGSLPTILASDTINGASFAPADVSLTIDEVRGPDGNPSNAISVNSVGVITVPPGTPAGSYEIDYTICEITNSNNCASVTETVAVISTPIVAVNNDFTDAPISAGNGGTTPSIFGNDMLDNASFAPADVTPTLLNDGGLAGATVNSDGTISVPPGATPGPYTLTYQICEAANPSNCDTAMVTIVIGEDASLSGVVFLDTDGDDVLDANETVLTGYIVEVMLDGQVVASAVTDENGFYSIDGLEPNDQYMIVFRNPETRVAAGVVDEFPLAAGQNLADQNLPIDPSGVVYDFATGTPIAGATVTIFGPDGAALPGICLVDVSQQNQTTGSTGFYAFDLVPGADPACPAAQTEYTISVTLADGSPGVFGVPPQPGALDATSCPVDAIAGAPCEVSASPTAPVGGGPIDFFTAFLLEPGDQDVINNHLPIDLQQTGQPLMVTKSANVATTQVGGLVLYTIRVSNNLPQNVTGFDLVDAYPAGFSFVEGSARLDGVAVTTLEQGRRLEWSDLNIGAGEVVEVTLVLVAGSGVQEGEFVNLAFAESSIDSQTLSNIAEARVRITPDEVFDCAEVIGKVFFDANQNGVQDKGENGVAGARVATVNGLLITTDEYGRYHIACAATPKPGIGSNFILKLDERTLPAGHFVSSENPRVIRLTEGKLSQLNFSISAPQIIELTLTQNAFDETGGFSPALKEKLSDVVALLKETKSSVRLTYKGAGAGRDVLKAVDKNLRSRWDAENEPYELSIERIVIE